MKAYRHLEPMNGDLPVTSQVARMTLTLPLWNGMDPRSIRLVGRAIEEIRADLPRCPIGLGRFLTLRGTR